MNAFSDDHVARAIAAVPTKSNAQLRKLLKVAQERGITALEEAIEAELELRGDVEVNEDAALRHAEWSKGALDLDRYQTIVYAFEKLPANEEEILVVSSIASQPGISFKRLTQVRGKGDVGLIIGHLVYERFGAFRHLLAAGDFKMPSDILLERTHPEGGVAYTLRPEAAGAFEALGVIPS